MWAKNSKLLALFVTLVSTGPAASFSLASRLSVFRQSSQLFAASSSEGDVAQGASRRQVLSALGAGLAVMPTHAFAAGAAPSLAEVTTFLKDSREVVSTIPKLLQVHLQSNNSTFCSCSSKLKMF